MSELVDEAIDRGVRKRTQYDSSRRARLALNIDRTDGGMLQIVVEIDMRSNDEEPDIQQNTFLAVLPMARLPGHHRYNVEPKGALPRPGYIYIFQQGKLWRELVCDGKGNLADTDVAFWRIEGEERQPSNERPAVGKPLAVTLVPMLLQGRFVGDRYNMAYSETAWTWEYITWLEADGARITDRCQNLGPAWAAAIIDPGQWRTTQAMPVLVIEKQVEGLRARDFSVECMLADPADFSPDHSEFAETEYVIKLQCAQEQLANLLEGDECPLPLQPLEAGNNVLSEKSLYGYPRLVGVLLDDPLFELRHATAQVRLLEAYLLTLNALIPLRPNGRYAQAVYSTVMRRGSNPLAKFSELLDQSSLFETVFENERRAAREQLDSFLRKLVRLLESRLHVVAQDYLHAQDERLLEPYAWLTELLDALNTIPSQCDVLCLDRADSSLESSINRLVQSVLQATQPLAKQLLAEEGKAEPDAVQRLKRLIKITSEPEPSRMGLSSLLLTANIETTSADPLAVGKNMTALVGDLMDTFATAVGTQINRISGSLVNVELARLFAPTFNVAEKLSPSWSGLKLMPHGSAAAEGLVILGVEGAGLKFGLTADERTTLTRKSYRYATLHDKTGKAIGSSSPRHSRRQLDNIGRITVIAAPADHPQVRSLSAWKVDANRQIKTFMETPAVPSVAVVCALFNLQSQIVGMRGLLHERGDGFARYIFGGTASFLDLTVAVSSLTKPLMGPENSLVKALNKPRFDISKVSRGWARALYEQTGSTRLPILRLASGWAMIFTSGLALWDAKRAWHQGDHDASIAYGVAAIGGAAWTAYAFGMAINPFVLIAGGALFITGSVLASWLVDSDAEALLKNGPFGRDYGKTGTIDSLFGSDRRFDHLQDPQIAYHQLLGILGKPVIRVSRLADWRKQASRAHQSALENIQIERQSSASSQRLSCVPQALMPIEDQDWVLTIHSPLLSMFRTGQEFQLFAEEQLCVLPINGSFNVERVERREISEPKLTAMPLDETSVLYVLPRQFPLMQLSPLQRHSYIVTHRIKTYAQFRLVQGDGIDQRLVLPQPNPKRWQPYETSLSRQPARNAKLDELPYWMIEINEFKA